MEKSIREPKANFVYMCVREDKKTISNEYKKCKCLM